jgi:hypothetical protein
LLSFNSKFTNLVKTDMILNNGENRIHSDVARQIYFEKFRQMILPNARNFVNVVQHLRDFGRFETNKLDSWPPTRSRFSCRRSHSSRFPPVIFQLTCGLGLLKINSYLQFLNEVLSELVEDILLAIRRKMWYLYDG